MKEKNSLNGSLAARTYAPLALPASVWAKHEHVIHPCLFLLTATAHPHCAIGDQFDLLCRAREVLVSNFDKKCAVKFCNIQHQMATPLVGSTL